jgi:hypothetical protein
MSSYKKADFRAEIRLISDTKKWKGVERKKGISITRKQGKDTNKKGGKKYQHGKGREKI